MNRRTALIVAACGVVFSSLTVVKAQTAYFSTQGDFVNASSLQDFFITTSGTITSSQVMRFETFSSRGTTLNAAGDTSPTIAHGFDSNLTLTNTFGGTGPFSNDDGAAGSNLDSLLSWTGVADSGGNLGTSLSSSLYRLRLNEFDNLTGPWGVDLVGPASQMTFGGFASAGGLSTMSSLKFGTDGVADLNAPANAHARFNQTSTALIVTGDFVVGQTGNASYTAGSLPGVSLTVGGFSTVKLGGDITLSSNSVLTTVRELTIDGGRASLSDTARINLGDVTGLSDLYIHNGGRVDMNAGTTISGVDATIRLGDTGNATENQFVVTNGTVVSKAGIIGFQSGSNNRATLTGASTAWTMTSDLYVGRIGNGTLEISNGAKVTNRDGLAGYDVGGVGTVTLTGNGSTWTNTRDLYLGDVSNSGVGHLTINAGARLNVGDTAASNVGFGPFSFIEDAGPGAGDGGVLAVYAGSTLTNTANSGLSIGRGVGRRGSVIVSGAGSTVNDNETYLGFSGTGTLAIDAGGKYIANNAFFATSGGTATVTVEGAGSQLWSKGNLDIGSASGGAGNVTTTNGGTILVGDAATTGTNFDVFIRDANPIGTAGGVVLVANGSTLTNALQIDVGAFGTTGRMSVTGAGSIWTSGKGINLGFQGTGDIQVSNGGLLKVLNNAIEVGWSTNGVGTVSVSGAGRIEVPTISIARDATSTGTVTVAGTNSVLATSDLQVGNGGTATLNIQSSGKVTAADAVVGNGATGVGTINFTGAGSLLDIERDLIIGNLGRGTVNGQGVLVGDAATESGDLDISDSNLAGNAGGNVVLNNSSTWTMNNSVRLASPANTYGRLAVSSGSSFTTNSSASVGNLGTGVLEISSGGRFTTTNPANGFLDLGFNAPTGRGTVTVDGVGSILDVITDVTLGNLTGNNGTALSTLTVRNNGRLLVGDSTFDPSMLNGGPEGAPLVQVDISDNERDGSEGGLIDIRPGSLLSASADVGIASEFSSYGRVDVNGVSGTTPARMTVGTDLIVARGFTTNGTPLQSVGILNITAGGRVEVGQNMLIASSSNANGTVTVSGAGSLLDVTNDLRVGPGGGTSNVQARLNINTGGTVVASDLIINNVAATKIDMGLGGTMLLDIGAPNSLEEIRGYILSGYNAGAWTGPGIMSTAAQTDTRLGVGYIDDTGITIKLTLKGDTDLSGNVNFDDLLKLAQNYNFSNKFWQDGDFNYDSNVNFDDLLPLAQNYNLALSVSEVGSLHDIAGSSFAADWAMAQSMVPEPATAALLLACPLARRRRGVMN